MIIEPPPNRSASGARYVGGPAILGCECGQGSWPRAIDENRHHASRTDRLATAHYYRGSLSRSFRSLSRYGLCWRRRKQNFQYQPRPRGRGCKRGPRCCASGLRRNQKSRSRPSRASRETDGLVLGAVISRCDPYSYLAERCGRSRGKSLAGACVASRSRRSSSMRARMAAKSSAARGRFMFPPVHSVAFLVALCGSWAGEKRS